jgi:hypothetical protein
LEARTALSHIDLTKMLQPLLASGLLFRGLTRTSFCRLAKAASRCAPAETRPQVLSRQAHQISRSAQYQYVIRQRKEFVRLLVNDKQYVKVFLRTLPPEARANLFEELKHLKQREAEGKLRQMDMADVPEPTREQFVKIFIRAGAPFVVFGFIDNSLMIVCFAVATKPGQSRARLAHCSLGVADSVFAAFDRARNTWAMLVLFCRCLSALCILSASRVLPVHVQIAGETLDITLGAVLGITTMTAAATGNMISVCAGVRCICCAPLWLTSLESTCRVECQWC